MSRKIIHIDMDCFYAAIEMRDNPSLTNVPMAVGGDPGRRGVLCTSNYIAREYGVRSAMASAYAKKLCPSLTIVPPNFSKYKEVSDIVQDVFKMYTDKIEPLSLDEAYLDVSECKAQQGSATLIAREIRDTIKSETKVTASAGVASNKFLAKIASDLNKPNGQYVITPDQVDAFMYELPVKKIWGVGKVTAKKLDEMNITTCGDLQRFTEYELEKFFGTFGTHLYHYCRGIDNRKVETNRKRKSISVERTYHKDFHADLNEIQGQIFQLFDDLQRRIHAFRERYPEQARFNKCFIKIRYSDFTRTTVERVCPDVKIENFLKLFEEGVSRKNMDIRLLGLGVRVYQKQDDLQTDLFA